MDNDSPERLFERRWALARLDQVQRCSPTSALQAAAVAGWRWMRRATFMWLCRVAWRSYASMPPTGPRKPSRCTPRRHSMRVSVWPSALARASARIFSSPIPVGGDSHSRRTLAWPRSDKNRDRNPRPAVALTETPWNRKPENSMNVFKRLTAKASPLQPPGNHSEYISPAMGF
jgi:hypothetical protein